MPPAQKSGRELMNGLVVFIIKTVDQERLTEPPNEAQESRFCGHAEQRFATLSSASFRGSEWNIT